MRFVFAGGGDELAWPGVDDEDGDVAFTVIPEPCAQVVRSWTTSPRCLAHSSAVLRTGCRFPGASRRAWKHGGCWHRWVAWQWRDVMVMLMSAQVLYSREDRGHVPRQM